MKPRPIVDALSVLGVDAEWLARAIISELAIDVRASCPVCGARRAVRWARAGACGERPLVGACERDAGHADAHELGGMIWLIRS